METTRTLSKEEINRNYERTLSLLRSTKPEAADLMLNMLNDSIIRKYGHNKQVIDVRKFSKVNTERSDKNNIKVPSKKPKIRKIKNEKNHQISNIETNLSELSNGVNITDNYKNTKQNSEKCNNIILKNNKSKTKTTNNERYKSNCCEEANIPTAECDKEIMNNASQTFTKNKNLNNKTKFNLIPKLNENIENSDGTQENMIDEIQNTENLPPKEDNESFGGIPPTIKRVHLQQKSIAKAKSHKKPLLHELSSRQRIQAVLEKGINNK